MPSSTRRLRFLVQRAHDLGLGNELSRITDDGPPTGDAPTRRLLRALRGELVAHGGRVRCVLPTADMRPVNRMAARVLKGREGGR